MTGSVGCSRKAARPSIILITLDTVRADRLSCYGYARKTTPNLDAFARSSVVFQNIITPMSTTLPSHISMLTSLHPLAHGIKGNFSRLERVPATRDGLRTLPELLAPRGWMTAAFVSATPVKKHTGIDAGFSVFDEPDDFQRRAAKTTDAVLSWLEKPNERPLFLWVHYFDPHTPYDPPSPYDSMYSTDAALRSFLATHGWPAPQGPHVEAYNNRYDGELSYMDAQIGTLIEGLKRRGLYAESAIVIAGDHGEGLGQHNWIEHGHIYNEQIFVPLLMRFPDSLGIRPDTRAVLGSLMDIVPTLVETLRLPLSRAEKAQFEGLNLLENPPHEDRAVLSERVNRQRRWEPGFKYSLTSLTWKYSYVTTGSEELFDMRADRIETKNVLHRYPDVARRMKQELLGMLRDYAGKRVGSRAADGVPAEVLEQLRGLGYVE